MNLETFFEKFDLFADAPNAVARIRELIWQLAVQGRLVAQDRSDEDAAVLLQRIVSTRADLVENGKSRSEVDTITLETERAPYPAPKGWVWTVLGNVQVFTNGYAFKSEDYRASGVGIIRMGELGANGEIDESNMKYVSDEIADSLPAMFRVRPGDLLIGMSGSIGKLAINHSNKTYLLNQRVGRLEPVLIEKGFLRVFLRTVEQHYLRISFGMAIKNLSTKQINETPFPLPPLAEQKRIVAKVDELMALCDRLEAQQKERETRHAALARASLARFADAPTPANLNFIFHKSYDITPADLRKTILTLAVQGKLVPQDPNDEPATVLLERIKRAKEALIAERRLRKSDDVEYSVEDELGCTPPGWIGVYVNDVAIVQGGKRLPNGAAFSESPTPHIYIRVTDMKNGTIAETGLKYISSTIQREIARYTINKDDLYITIAGTIGAVGSVPDSVDGHNLTENAAKIVFRELDKRFFQLALTSDFVQAQFLEKTKQMAQPKLALKRIAGAKFYLPPLAEQRRIVAKVDELMALVDALETQLATARTTAEKLMEAVVAEVTAVKRDTFDVVTAHTFEAGVINVVGGI